MPSLLELQRAVAHELDMPSELVASSFIVSEGIDAAHRLGIYRNTCVGVLTTALRISYPVLQRLVGEEFFEGAMRQFIERWPPTSAYLNEYGAELGDFLSEFEPAASLPYLPDVARLEWAVNCALHAPEAPALDPTRLLSLSEIDRCRVRFVPHPSVTLLHTGCPADLISRAVLAHDDAALDAIDPQGGPAWLVVERRDTSVEVSRMTEEEWTFAKRLCNGCELQAALQVSDARTAADWLAEHLAVGRFTDFTLSGALQ